MTWSWAPVAILAVLLLALAVSVLIESGRARRRIDPLTPEQVARAQAIQIQRDQEAGRG